MTTFVTWHKRDDKALRKRYKEVTGEDIQEYPEEIMGDEYRVGSSRITQEQADILGAEFEGLSFTKEKK